MSYTPPTAQAKSSVFGTVKLAGDLGGTAATPTVAKVNGVAISGTPSSSQVLVASSSLTAGWANVSAETIGASQVLVPTSVKTFGYSAVPGDFVPVDTSGGSVRITLPAAPADQSRIAVKMIRTAVNSTNGYGNNIVIFHTGGSDVLNVAGGATAGYLTVLNQAVTLQYGAGSNIWYIQSDVVPQSSAVLGLSHTVTTDYEMTATDHVVLADATSGPFTVTLPTAVDFSGRYTIDAITSTTNIVTVDTTSGQTIDGASTVTLGTPASGAAYYAVDIISDGANWRVV